MQMKTCIWHMAMMLVCVCIFNGCGETCDNENMSLYAGTLETDIGEHTGYEISAALGSDEYAKYVSMTESVVMDASVPETRNMQEQTTEENEVIEVYNGRDVISVSGIMTAQVPPQEFLTGNPFIYNCFRTDV